MSAFGSARGLSIWKHHSQAAVERIIEEISLAADSKNQAAEIMLSVAHAALEERGERQGKKASPCIKRHAWLFPSRRWSFGLWVRTG